MITFKNDELKNIAYNYNWDFEEVENMLKTYDVCKNMKSCVVYKVSNHAICLTIDGTNYRLDVEGNLSEVYQ